MITNNDKNSQVIYSWEELYSELSTPLITPTLSIHLLRHGESEANKKGEITGRRNIPLTSRGVLQARNAGFLLDATYDLAYTSSLERCIKTLEIATKNNSINIPKPVQDLRIDEINLGILEGLPRRRIPEYEEGNLAYKPEQGESYLELTQRCLSFLIDLVKLSQKTNNPKKVLISTHHGPMRVFVSIIKQKENPKEVFEIKFDNTQIVKLTLKTLEFPPFVLNNLRIKREGKIVKKYTPKTKKAFPKQLQLTT